MNTTLTFLCFLPFFISLTTSINSDGLSLLALKAAITKDPTNTLISWSYSDFTPCKWAGITCDQPHHKVTSISLSSKNLTGYIPSEIGALSSLTFLDLSQNSFGGPLPHQITTLHNLIHLDLSSNNFSGSLPETLSNLRNLRGSLNLSYNEFSGEIPASFGRFPVMVSLDLRRNNLTGKIPQVGSLLNQGPTAFLGNPYLCGFPLSTQCTIAEAQSPRFLKAPQEPLNADFSSNGIVENRKMKSGLIIIFMILGIFLVMGVVCVLVWVIKRRRKMEKGKMGREVLSRETVGNEEGQKGKFVVLDEGFGLELEDLLRASAYVLGKSRSGIVYKVVVCGGKGAGLDVGGVGGPAVVAVRRLSEGDATWRLKEFEAEVEAVSRVRHPNIVRLRAYYYASDEKLLVSEFIGNGSLYNALHGPVNNSPPLSWVARLRIIQETARALMHIHECSHKKYVHANIKSSKILLDDNLKPCISGFGLSRLVQGTSKSSNPSSKKQSPSETIVSSENSFSSSTATYLAPEVRDLNSKYTQKCDVYSFGVVLLEILTGRLPDDGEGLVDVVRRAFCEGRPLSEVMDPALLHEVRAKNQVITTFHVALNCAESDPELRPRMRTVCESLDCVKLQ